MDINLNRDIIIDIDLNNGKIDEPYNASYYNTDSNIAFFYVKLHKMNAFNFTEYISKEDAGNYKVVMKIVKPKTLIVTELIGTISDDLDEDCAIYKFIIKDELMNEVGEPFCYISIYYNNQELVTNGFNYTVKQDPLGKYNLVLLNDPDMPLLKSLLEEIKNNVGGIDDGNVRDDKSFSSYKTTQIANNLSSQIKEKANLNSVFSMANMGQDIKEAMTGGSVAVVDVNAILEKNIVRGQVTPLKTSFFEEGKNLFNKNTSKTGYYVNYQDGELAENLSYCASDYILVYPNTTYTMASDERLRIAFYDANKTFISGLNTGVQTITTPPNCYYIRYSFNKATLDLQQFELGETSTAYASYVKPHFDLTYILDNTLSGQKLEDNSVTSKKLTIIKNDTNLFGGDYTNYKITGSTGSLQLKTGDSNCKTAVIKIKPNTTYSIIRQVPSRFNYGTSTHELTADEFLDGAINVNRSGNGETSSDPYVTFTTGENDQYLYINTTIDGKNILLQVVEGEQSGFTIKDYRLQLNNIDVYNRNEIDELLVNKNKCKFVKTGDVCTITTAKAKFIFKRVTDTSINVDAWRLYEGKLINDDGTEYTMWSNSDAEGAIQIVGEDDFVCGYHGDEIFETINIVVDGKPINIDANYNMLFNNITIVSTSKVYHCNTSASASTQAFKRTKMLKFENGKVTISNRFECLENLNINRASLALFQCRKSQDNTTIINKFSNNNDLILYDVPTSDTGTMPEQSVNMTQATFYTNCGVVNVKITKGYDHPKYMGYISNFNDQNRLKVYFDYIKGNTEVNVDDILQTEFEFSIT